MTFSFCTHSEKFKIHGDLQSITHKETIDYESKDTFIFEEQLWIHPMDVD